MTYRDLRNQSRDFETVGNQWLIDLRLNAFGLELFVESYWDTMKKMITSGDVPTEHEKDLKIVFNYRGMTITLDPSIGLAAWERPIKEKKDE